mmetsp:Transcript_17164/g.34735  ORF Transcript_17164/g.34735 Transcript_17164/m.34735 type:complete len:173 (+) Transcript_17164:524-1042(+)
MVLSSGQLGAQHAFTWTRKTTSSTAHSAASCSSCCHRQHSNSSVRSHTAVICALIRTHLSVGISQDVKCTESASSPLPADFSARDIPIENPWDPAVEQKAKLHPMFRRCAEELRIVVLRRGDLLVQPRGWSHWVYNLELSLSVACWAKACPPPGEAIISSEAGFVGHQTDSV